MPPPEPRPADRPPSPEPAVPPAPGATAAAGPATPSSDGPDLDANPSLRAYLRAQGARIPSAWVRAGLAVLAIVLVAVLVREWRGTDRSGDGEREASLARAEWAAIQRQTPSALGDGLVTGTLGPGDAERSDDRYADYFVHEHADSTAFSVVVTSAEFAPDLSVRLPSGQTIAASNLLRTQTRAEIEGLTGPGRFEVVVTSREARAEGAYEVLVVPAGPIDSVYVDDEAVIDTLGTGPRRAGRFERTYGIVAGPDDPVVVRVVSSAFVPRLHLLGPNGEVEGSWRTLERISSGDSLFGVVLRYLPGWEAPYRLLVTSEAAGATGPFALDVQSVPTRDLRAEDRGVTRRLGDESWLVGRRYVDYYRLRTRSGERSILRATSREIPPALRLWRLERSTRDEVAAALNPGGAGEAEIREELDAGEYILEVTTGGADTLATPGGEYALTFTSEPIEPAPRELSAAPTDAQSRVFGTEVRRSGESGGNTFEVGVTTVAVSYPAGRTRVQLSVSVRSIDYSGNWAPWTSFVGKGYVVDDMGKRYTPSQVESKSPSGSAAEPGTVRRGTVVFYAPGTITGQSRFVYVASIGENTVTLPIPVP